MNKPSSNNSEFSYDLEPRDNKERKKSEKEKKKDNELSRFERIQEALRRALESLLDGPDNESDKRQKMEQAHADKSSTTEKPSASSEYELSRGEALRREENLDVSSPPGITDSEHVQYSGARESDNLHRFAERDNAWQRARTKVRTFIQDKINNLELNSDAQNEGSAFDEEFNPMASSTGSESDTVRSDAKLGTEHQGPEKAYPTTQTLNETERQSLTVSELERRYSDIDSSRIPEPQIHHEDYQTTVIDRRERLPAALTLGAGLNHWRRHKRESRLSEQLKKEVQQLDEQYDKTEKELARAVQKLRDAEHSPQTPEKLVRKSQRSISEREPEQSTASTQSAERRLSYPPAPAPELVQIQSTRIDDVENTESQLQQPVNKTETLTEEAEPETLPTPAAPVSVAEIIRSRHKPHEAEVMEVREDQSDKERINSRLSATGRMQSHSQQQLAQQNAGVNPPEIVVSNLHSQLKNKEAKINANRSSVKTDPSLWQQVLLVIINLVLIGILIRELVL